MVRVLSLAAALALLPISAAVAQDNRTSAEVELEAAAAAFESRMERFGERAELIKADASLSEDERELRTAALWSEYQPDVLAFTATATTQALQIASAALAEVDVEALVSDALKDVNLTAMATGVATNGAWASTDPDHIQTYGIIAEYALGEAFPEGDED